MRRPRVHPRTRSRVAAPHEAALAHGPRGLDRSRPKGKGTARSLKKLLGRARRGALQEDPKATLAHADRSTGACLELRLGRRSTSPRRRSSSPSRRSRRPATRGSRAGTSTGFRPRSSASSTTETWATFVETAARCARRNSGTISWKSPKAWRNRSSEMVQARRVREGRESTSPTSLAKTSKRCRSPTSSASTTAFFRIYEQYDVENDPEVDAVRPTCPRVLPPVGRLDRRSRRVKVASDIVDGWFAMPREMQPAQLRAGGPHDRLLQQPARSRPGARARRPDAGIKADSRTPDSVKAVIKSVP